jgi:fibro-slime domain-containing protein
MKKSFFMLAVMVFILASCGPTDDLVGGKSECNGVHYNSTSHFCYANAVYAKCSDKEYNPDIETCSSDGRIVSTKEKLSSSSISSESSKDMSSSSSENSLSSSSSSSKGSVDIPISFTYMSTTIYDTDPSVNSSFFVYIPYQVISAGISKGIAKPTLDANGKMQFNQAKDRWTEQNFIDAFNHVSGKNILRNYDIPFYHGENGYMTFDSDKLCADGTMAINGDCSGKGGLLGGFFPPALERDYADYTSCPTCDTKHLAEGWVPLADNQSRECYELGLSGNQTCGAAYGEGDFRDGDNPNIWDWAKRVDLGNTRKNLFYCLESRAKFTYKAGLKFFISGDDDIWVFINNELVIDLGGIHCAAPGYVNLDDLQLTAGNKYPIDIFLCDRQSTMSDLRISTNMDLEPATPN